MAADRTSPSVATDSGSTSEAPTQLEGPSLTVAMMQKILEAALWRFRKTDTLMVMSLLNSILVPTMTVWGKQVPYLRT